MTKALEYLEALKPDLAGLPIDGAEGRLTFYQRLNGHISDIIGYSSPQKFNYLNSRLTREQIARIQDNIKNLQTLLIADKGLNKQIRAHILEQEKKAIAGQAA